VDAPLQVDQVLIPATSGEFGVLPGHVPTVAQLKPGVLAVHLEADKNVKKARAQPWSRGRMRRGDTCRPSGEAVSCCPLALRLFSDALASPRLSPCSTL
jgi:hypothetical protein